MKFEVKNGTFAYPRQENVLNNVSVSLRDGEVMAILGPNGIGKTTMLKCMMGFLSWKAGVSQLDGTDIRTLPPAQVFSRIAYIPQAKPSGFSFTGLEMVTIGRSAHLGAFAQPSSADIAIARSAMGEIGVGHLANKSCKRMSGGELQMVLIARALAAQPSMMVLDEPESGLDFYNQLIILELIDYLVREKRLCAVINTHDPAHALKVANKTLMFCRGGHYYYGPTREIITEDNIREAFNVNVAMQSVRVGARYYDGVVPVSVATKNHAVAAES